MRNPGAGPKFCLAAAAVIFIALAVWPIGCAKAENISLAENHSEKSSAEGNLSLKPKRSLTSRDRNFADRNSVGHLHRSKWEAGEDQSDDYSQIEPFGPEGAGDGNYMADGYGYDDDEYDHLNDKRFGGDVDNLNDGSGKDQNSYDNNVIMTDKIESAPVPEATTIEMLNFQTKNLNPGSEDNSGNDSPTIKSLGSHKPFNSKESLVGVNMKKENDEHKSEDTKDVCPGNDKNTGQIKIADNKAAENKQSAENKAEVAKASDPRKDQKLKENEKENPAIASSPKFSEGSKNEAKIVSKEEKSAESKVQTDGREENDAASKLKDTKDLDDNISEGKINGEGEKHSQERSVSELFGSDYKDGFESMNESGLTDEEKSAEEKNIVGLRDTVNELPYMYMKGPLKGVRKKGVPRRNLGYWSNLLDAAKEERNADRGPKEPYRLDFPLADLENTDYHRNFVKSLKRFKSLDEPDRILSQGDSPSPFADQNKKQIAPQVIEEEQRKRRSRLRRLKAGPFFVVKERGRGDRGALYAYGPSIRARLPYGGSYAEAPRYSGRRATGMYRRNINNFDSSPEEEDHVSDDEELVNVKSIGDYEVRLSESGSEDEDDSFAEGLFQSERLIGHPAKRKSSSQKDVEMKLQKGKFKEQSANVDSSPTNTPLVLLQRKDNGAHTMKTFVESKNRNEEGVNLEDLAKLLSRDSNYVVLRKVPGKGKAQKVSNSGYDRQNDAKLSAGVSSESGKKDNFKSLHSDLSPKEYTIPIFGRNERKLRMESLAEGEKKKNERDNLIKSLKDDNLKQNKMLSTDSAGDHVSLFRMGEPNKKLVYKPPLSQAYRHMKDFESPAQVMHREMFRRSEKPEKSSQVGENRGSLGSERMVKSFKKEGKELLLLNRPYNAIAVKTKSQEAMVQDLGVNTATDNPLPPLSMYDPVMVPLVPPIQSPAAQYVSIQNQSPSKMAQQSYASQSTIPQFTNSQQSVNSAGFNSNGLVTGTNSNPAGNKVQNTNYGKTSGFVPTDGMIFNANLMPGNSFFNAVPSSIPAQNGMMVNSNTPMQIKLPEITQKASDYNRNYYLYGSQNTDRTNSPVHEIKVIQQGMNVPQGDSYKSPNFPYAGNVQNFDPKLQNYNKQSMLLKNPESGKATPGDKTNANVLTQQRPSTDTLLKHGSYSLTQHWLANVFQTNKKPMTVYDNYKAVLKKDDLGGQRPMSGSLKRFMRDFQGLGQPFIQSTYSGQQLPGMSFQELTRHSDKHLQKLNNFLREIISSRAEETGTEGKKNVKRGMMQKDKDDKAWREKNAEVNTRVSAGKWTSITSDSSSHMDNTGKNFSPEETLARNSEKTKEAKLNNQFLKRSKRSLSYDTAVKESTEAMEVKVKSIPYKVEPQRLDFTNVNSGQEQQQQQQQQSNSRSYMTIPPDKLMDLLNILPSLQGEERPLLNDMCKRQVSLDESELNAAFRRKLLSVGDADESSDVDKKQAECIRKSFESFLDPLVQKIADYENKRTEKARKKREIELDESTPNDFQNFLMTSLGGPGSQKREVVKKEEAIWESEAQHDSSNQIVDGAGNRDPNEGSAIGKREASGSGREPKSEKDSVFADDSTKIRIRIVDGNTDGELAKSTETGYKSQLTRKDTSVRDENNPRVHEVYLIAKADTKKKKNATPRSDQTVQKQPISSHLPQVETVYNPSPGSNKAQIENINEQKCFAKPQIYYNGSASSVEDNIIRTNLRTGNSNTFTYQSKEEHTPYPLQSPIQSLDYESPVSGNLNSPRSLSLQKSFASLTNSNQDIIYKDESPPVANMMTSNSKPNEQQADQQTFRSYDPTLPLRRESAKAQVHGNVPSNSNPDLYAAKGSTYVEQGRGNKYSLRADYDSRGNMEENGQALKEEDIEGLEETVNPKMVEMWKKYAKTYLTPSSHKEAMDREFKEAYLRTGASQIISKSDKDKFGASLIRGINQQDDDHLTRDKAEPSGFDKAREKIGKRRAMTNQNHNRPVQIGQRLFYSFKTEIPAQDYYTLYVGPTGLKNENGAAAGTKKTEDVQINPQGLKVKRESGETVKLDNNGNVIVQKSVSDRGENGGENRTKRKSELYEARNDFPESRNRVKRSAGSTKSVDEAKIMEKRLSSGHLTESHFRKYHRKNISEKRDAEEDTRGRVNVKHLCPDKRVRRDTLSDTLKADMSRRMEQEKKARMMVKNLKVELTKDESPFWSGNLIPLVNVPDENAKTDSAEDVKKEVTEPQKDERQEQAYQSHAKNDTPDVYKTYEIKRERRKSREFAKVKRTPREGGGHAILARSHLDQRKDLKTFSDEGFEPLTPDARFSERSSARSQGSKVPLSEPKKADRKVDKSRAAEKGAQKQFTHGFSHEAPLLTPLNPLESPKIFDALKRAPEADPKFGQQSDSADEAGKSRAGVNSEPKYAAKSATIESKSDPFVGAVLVLAKRESNRLDEAANNGSRHSELKKRKSEWSEIVEEPKQSLEIVNDKPSRRSCRDESDCLICNNKQTNIFKPFPFSQSHNIYDTRNKCEKERNPGEDVLENILAKVESNPRLKKVIGPGLKRREECPEEERLRPCYRNDERSDFIRQVRKILAKFVTDIERAAEQDMRGARCRKIDASSNRFLHELLGAPFEPQKSFLKPCNIRGDIFLGGRDRENATVGGTSEAANISMELVNAMRGRKQLLTKLMEEYQRLSESDRKRVEILGQYLSHELDVVNAALSIRLESQAVRTSSTFSTDRADGEQSTSRPESSSVTTESTPEISSPESCPTTKAAERESVELPLITSNSSGEDPKLVKPEYQSTTESNTLAPEDITSSLSPITECMCTSTIGCTSEESPITQVPIPTSKFLEYEEEKWHPQASRIAKKLGELQRLGYGDAASLQLALKSHAPWTSNLDLGKGKAKNIWQQPKFFQLPVTTSYSSLVTNVPNAFLRDPRRGNLRTGYDLEYSYYYYDDDDDAYQAPNPNKRTYLFRYAPTQTRFRR